MPNESSHTIIFIYPYNTNNDSMCGNSKYYYYSGNGENDTLQKLYIEYESPMHVSDSVKFNIVKSYPDKFLECGVFEYCLNMVTESELMISQRLLDYLLRVSKSTAYDPAKVTITKSGIKVKTDRISLLFDNHLGIENKVSWQIHFVNTYFRNYIPIHLLHTPTFGLSLYDLNIESTIHYSILAPRDKLPKSYISLFINNNGPYCSADRSSPRTNLLIYPASRNVSMMQYSSNDADDKNQIIVKYPDAKILDPRKLLLLSKIFIRDETYPKFIYDYLNGISCPYYSYVVTNTDYLDIAVSQSKLYFALLSDRGMSWSMNPDIYKEILKLDENTLECFATDNNHYCSKYCCLQFEGITNQSIGLSYFDLNPRITYTTLIINPPYEEILISKVMIHLLTLLRGRTAYVFLPVVNEVSEFANMIVTLQGSYQCNVIIRKYYNSVAYSHHLKSIVKTDLSQMLICYNPPDDEIIRLIDKLMIARTIQSD